MKMGLKMIRLRVSLLGRFIFPGFSLEKSI